MKASRRLRICLSLLLALSLIVGAAPAAQAAPTEQKSFKAFTEFGDGFAALRTNGTVALWSPGGEIPDSVRQEVGSWTEVTQILGCKGACALVALRQDGHVRAAGFEEDWAGRDALLAEIKSWRDIVSLVALDFFGSSVIALNAGGALKTAGREYADWGYYFSEWKGVKSISCGIDAPGYYFIGIRKNGTVISSPLSLFGNELEEYPWSGRAQNVVQVVSDGWTDAALRSNGKVVVRGYSAEDFSQTVSKWAGIQRIFLCGDLYALTSRGRLVSTNESKAEELNSKGRVKEIYSLPGSFASYDLAGAVLFADGSVCMLPGYSGEETFDEEPLRSVVEAVGQWRDVTRLWFVNGTLIGWQKDGTILSVTYGTESNPSDSVGELDLSAFE